jgi:hypothetical protein
MTILCERVQLEIVNAKDFLCGLCGPKLLTAKVAKGSQSSQRKAGASAEIPSGQRKIAGEKEQNFSQTASRRAKPFPLRKGGNQRPRFE